MKSRTLSIFFLLFVILIGCSKENSVNGHWHIYAERDFPNEFATIDINDTVATWDKLRSGDWLKSKIDTENKIIVLPQIEIYTKYKFYLKNDTLVLTELGRERMLYGLKREKPCRFEMDYFASLMVDINLPTINNSMYKRAEVGNLNFELFIGRPKIELKELYGDSLRLEVWSRFIDLDKLEISNMKHDLKVHEEKRPNINTLIFTDKDVPMNRLSEIIKRQRTVNNRKIFLAGKQKEDLNQQTKLSYFLIDGELIYNRGDSVEDWIKEKK